MFFIALLRTCFTLCEKARLLFVSPYVLVVGDKLQIISVKQLPPKESRSTDVIIELR